MHFMTSLIPDYKNLPWYTNWIFCVCNYDRINSDSFVLFVLIESVDHLFYCPWLHFDPPLAERLLWWDVFPLPYLLHSPDDTAYPMLDVFGFTWQSFSLYLHSRKVGFVSLCPFLVIKCVLEGDGGIQWLYSLEFKPKTLVASPDF